jgi:hypothetical protein
LSLCTVPAATETSLVTQGQELKVLRFLKDGYCGGAGGGGDSLPPSHHLGAIQLFDQKLFAAHHKRTSLVPFSFAIKRFLAEHHKRMRGGSLVQHHDLLSHFRTGCKQLIQFLVHAV